MEVTKINLIESANKNVPGEVIISVAFSDGYTMDCALLPGSTQALMNQLTNLVEGIRERSRINTR